jgi:hypothetical protein
MNRFCQVDIIARTPEVKKWSYITAAFGAINKVWVEISVSALYTICVRV